MPDLEDDAVPEEPPVTSATGAMIIILFCGERIS